VRTATTDTERIRKRKLLAEMWPRNRFENMFHGVRFTFGCEKVIKDSPLSYIKPENIYKQI